MNGLDGQAFVRFAEVLISDGLHAFDAAIHQETQLIIRLEDTRHLIHEVANLTQAGIGRPLRSPNRLRDGLRRAHCVSPCATELLADASRSAGSKTRRTLPSPLMVAPAMPEQ